VLKEIGCNVEDEYVEKLIGIGAKNTFRKVLEAADLPFADEDIEELVKKKVEVQMKLTNTVKLFEGALDLLSSLHNRTKISLASMNNRKVIDKLLSEKGVRGYFDVVITADEVLQPKPNPEIFLECATKLRVTPEKCVVVEDSIFGVDAAKQAEMKCIAIPTGAYSKEELAKKNPDLIVDSLKEEDKILNFILYT
jgi:HAD superfamily hydrolase (TIGR01509 family)